MNFMTQRTVSVGGSTIDCIASMSRDQPRSTDQSEKPGTSDDASKHAHLLAMVAQKTKELKQICPLKA